MKDMLMRLVALSALAATGDMLAPEGAARRSVRFIGGLLAACVMADMASNLVELIGA